MKRIRRIMLDGFMVLSLLLCLATGGLAVRSWWVSDEFFWRYIPQDMGYYKNFVVESSRCGLTVLKRFGHFGYFGGYIRRGHVFGCPHTSAMEYPYWLPRPPNAEDKRVSRGFRMFGFQAVHEIEYFYEGPDLQYQLTSVTFPLPILSLLGTFLPVRRGVSIYRMRKVRKRQSRGLCTKCSYDLRCTPIRCPECGTIPKEANA